MNLYPQALISKATFLPKDSISCYVYVPPWLAGRRIFAHSPQMPHIMVMTLRLCVRKCFPMLTVVACFFPHIAQSSPIGFFSSDVSAVWSPVQLEAIISKERLRHHQLAFTHPSKDRSTLWSIYWLYAYMLPFTPNPKLSLTSPPMSGRNILESWMT